MNEVFESDGYRIEVDNMNKENWNDLLKEFNDANIHQSWSWGSGVDQKDNLSHLVIKKEEQLLAICQVVVKKVPLLKAGLANVYYGPLWRRRGAVEDSENFRISIKALKDEYVERRGFLLRIWPNEFEEPQRGVASILGMLGFRRDDSMEPYRTLRLDITQPLDQLRQNLAETWRRGLKRAEKKGFTVVEGNSGELYAVYLGLLKEMIGRKRFMPGVDYEAHRKVQEDLPEHLKMRIMICEFDGQPVSSVICSAVGETAEYLLGATGTRGLGIHASKLLHWRMIQRFKELGYKWYDLGGIDPNRNPGGYQFKRHLGGDAAEDKVYIGTFEASNTRVARCLGFAINRSRNLRTIIRGLLSLTRLFGK
jgi:lipid II:glycine glycyltransferase (peptidoglycan interpeptide bridge formation enzyme)